MPSIGELQLIYENVYTKGKGNFNSIYHSSTEAGSSAWTIEFNGSTENGTPHPLWKGASVNVRAVRSF